MLQSLLWNALRLVKGFKKRPEDPAEKRAVFEAGLLFFFYTFYIFLGCSSIVLMLVPVLTLLLCIYSRRSSLNGKKGPQR